MNPNEPFILNNVYFNNRLLNASGCWCTNEKELLELNNSESGGVVSKSCTLEPFSGNKFPRYYHNDILSINSTGLANNGWKYYNEIGYKITKPYFISIGVKNIDNTLDILKDLAISDLYNFIELNVSCPNIIGKSILGYDLEETDNFLNQVFNIIKNKNIGLKLPPYFDISFIKKFVNIIKKYPISFITTINGMPNGLVLDHNHKPVIYPNNGIGGIGGKSVKPFALSNVYHFHQLLPNLPIIGCGGISTRKDVQDFLSCGASLVQIGTQLVKDGPSIFKNILKEEDDPEIFYQ